MHRNIIALQEMPVIFITDLLDAFPDFSANLINYIMEA